MAVLNTEYLKQNTIYNPDPTEKDILRILQENETEDFEEVLSEDDRFEVFSQLSQLRTSILNWYEFKQDSSLLEIGGEFGALTGLFCDRCLKVSVTEQKPYRAEAICNRYRSRENLTIYAGEFDDIVFQEKFDYITIIGFLETMGKGSADKQIYSDFIGKAAALLKPDGKILLAVENRYGIRYFCGAQEPHTGKPFDGINHYLRGTRGYSFNKQELSDILNLAGLPEYKFYYPLPDYKITQLVYTDSYLPEKNLQERLIPYYPDIETLVALEHNLYDDIIDNKVFSFFANSYLVEISRQKDFCSVIYAALSTDRGKDYGFATTIHADRLVKKSVLYNEGQGHLNNILQNIRSLEQHAVPVLKHELVEKALVLPYVEADTLLNYVRRNTHVTREELEQIFDRLYLYIVTSSDTADATENRLMTENTRNLDWGIILKEASIELIPLNCFYIDGQFMFFDQEFVRKNYPAKYVLFRAIHYTYSFAPDAESIMPKQQLINKYGLTALWGIFMEEERKFLSEIRHHNLYKQFYQWARLDDNRIISNIDRLSYRGESLTEYRVPTRLKKLQEVQLDLLVQLKEVCERHRLHYFLFYGTLLGAVRHRGFIPWDDDIDVILPREDYDKLLSLAATEFREPYYFQTPENNAGSFYGGYSKLRNSSTTGIEFMNWGHDCNHGIWIDIFPLDLWCSDEKQNRKKLQKICYYQRLIYAKIYGNENKFKDMKFLQWKKYCFITKLCKLEKLYKKLDQIIKMSDNKDTEYLGIFTHYMGGKIPVKLYREDFKSAATMKYENLRLPVPAGYERCLKMTFGDEYLRYPSVINRRPHHKAFFAPNVPYKAYTARFFDIFKDLEGKTIVLFGAGLMFEDYMKKYGRKYPPAYIADNDPSKWETMKQGIPVKNPEVLLKADKEKLHLIICNIYYRQIEAQLRKMGIMDYYIYVQEREWLASDPPERK